MTEHTPDAPNSGPAKKPVTRKTSTRKPASKAVPTQSAAGTPGTENTADATHTPLDEAPVAVEADSAAVPETAQQDAIAARKSSTDSDGNSNGSHNGNGVRNGSVLDGVRGNPAGPLAVGLVVALGVGLLLSVLVPSDPNALALIILGTLLAAAVGFTVRYLSILRNVARQIETLVVTVIGVHVMAITGMVSGDIPGLSQLGIGGPGFNEALLAAMATPPVSTGSLVAGVVAAIIVGWKPGNRIRG